MLKPIIAGDKPINVNLIKGQEYYFCTCGQSDNQPFCNGSHKGSEFSPMKFIADKESAYLCACKQTKNAPYCDGSHKQLNAEN